MVNNYANGQADALFLSDSIGKHVLPIFRTDILFFSGCTIGALNHKISCGEVNISGYNYITILIGTNDLAPKDIWSFYVKEKRLGKSGENLPFHILTPIPLLTCRYQTLISTIKNLNPNCKLGFLGILPRPYDHHRNRIHHVEVNQQLQRICTESEITFMRTHTSFLKFGKPIDDLFADGLHLSHKGSLQLRELVLITINRFRSEDKLNN